MKTDLERERYQLLMQNFAKLVCDSSLWVFGAKKLFASANLFKSEIRDRWNWLNPLQQQQSKRKYQDGLLPHQLQSVYLMMIGFALENLMKGFLVKQHNDSIRPQIVRTGRLPKLILTHDLEKLAKSCGLEQSKKEFLRLRRLTQHAKWAGRYHFPLDFKEFYHLSPTNKIPSSGKAYGSDEVDEIEQFIFQVSKTLGFELAANDSTLRGA